MCKQASVKLQSPQGANTPLGIHNFARRAQNVVNLKIAASGRINEQPHRNVYEGVDAKSEICMRHRGRAGKAAWMWTKGAGRLIYLARLLGTSIGWMLPLLQRERRGAPAKGRKRCIND